ncbi:MAG: helix-turn-helix domain-containing protein [Bacteroidales bacterium]|nr:helix-turn-helix domain-containing protein [Bacteroidales bacterium]
MPRKPIDPVPLDNKTVAYLINDCLHKKGLKKKDLASLAGYRNVQSVSNFLSGQKAMSMAVLGRWCKALEYPIEDLLRNYPYAEPGTIAAVDADLQRTKQRVKELEGQLEAIRSKLDSICTDQ